MKFLVGLLYSKQNWTTNVKRRRDGLWKIANDTINKSSRAPLASVLQNFDSVEKAANVINDEFAQHFSDAPDWPKINDQLTMLPEIEVWDPDISVQVVHGLLGKLDAKKASGSDGLPPRLLREARDVIAAPLTHLICLSLETAQVPKCWKSASITPIPKSRSPTLKDLRPISNLPIFSKILEKCMFLLTTKQKLVQLHGTRQFGFRPDSSTLIFWFKKL